MCSEEKFRFISDVHRILISSKCVAQVDQSNAPPHSNVIMKMKLKLNELRVNSVSMELPLNYNRSWTSQHEFDSIGKLGNKIQNLTIVFNSFFFIPLEIAFFHLAGEWTTYPNEWLRWHTGSIEFRFKKFPIFPLHARVAKRSGAERNGTATEYPGPLSSNESR